MIIKLLTLELKNFQGIKELEIDFSGEDFSIYGSNGVGKTTIANAINWLLFDKDTQGKKDFSIKTLDENGDVVPGIAHTVYGELEIGGRSVWFGKSYYEKWVKKRGSVKPEFTGHTTDYEIGRIPVKKKEYDAEIAEIIDESKFRLLTSPTYFNEQLGWDQRRTVLIDAFGDVSTDDVIAANKGLKKLPNILENRDVVDHQKVIASAKKIINKKLKELPARIDEAEMMLPEKPKGSKTALSKKLRDNKILASQKEKQILSIDIRGTAPELLEQRVGLEKKLSEIHRSHHKEFDGELKKLRTTSNNLYDRLNDLEIINRGVDRTIATENANISHVEEDIADAEKRMEKLRSAFAETTERIWGGDEVCPVCKQELPADEVEAARDKFNRKKAAELEDINRTGKGLAGVVAESREIIAAAQKKVEELESQRVGVDTVQAEIDSIQKDIKASTDKQERYDELPGYVVIAEKIEAIAEKIDTPDAGKEKIVEQVRGEIAALGVEQETLEDDIQNIRLRAKGEARIKELKDSERDLAAEYERLEKELFLTEEFVRARVAMLEDKINDKFEITTFKLFRQQINEGITEICEAMVDGVPYSTGLNGGAKINSGLDIINTLSNHYDFYPPICIDNAESVVKLMPMDAQVIRLVVSEGDKVLRIEEHKQDSKKAA